MALKILIVDPDEAWLANAKKYLVEQMYEVSIVNNGRDAQLALYNDKYFAVILNYDVQNHSCTQVLKFIKTNYTNQRVIVIVNNKELVDNGVVTEEKLQKLGVAEMAVKPFEIPHLKELLEGHQSLGDLMASVTKKDGATDEIEVTVTDENFSRIKIDEFFSSQAVLFDIYIKLKENKYLKILHAGDSFSKERIDKYKNEKKLDSLYFHNNDRRKFIQYNNFLAKRLIDNKAVPAYNKVNQLKNVSEKFIEEAYTIGMKPQVIEQGKEVCENIYLLIESQPDLFSVLRSFQNFDPTAYAHSFLVTLYSTAIIKQFEWQSKATIETTAMACMFHDVGKMLLPKELAGLKVKDMTPEQFEAYKQHPILGAQVVEGNRAINNSIKQIIMQHHEAYDGTGFPYERKGNKILTLANIVCLVDDFVHIMMEDKLQPTEALRKILTNKVGVKRYNSILIEKFINVFVDPEKIHKEVALPSNSRLVNQKKVS
ncbi:MAG: HD domain-containing phosphohydrolase [Bacteriovorax sp.]|nr:HD domain-containing phosphohydrolase [Bacteriovorax sp.]